MINKKRITIGVTGASGAIYAQRLLDRLASNEAVERIELVMTQAGVRVVHEELGINVAGSDRRVVESLLGRDVDKVIVHSANDIGASIASGSYLSDAMVILPCSMGSLAAIAHGVTRDLVHRAADVIIKENRLLIIVPRETPLNAIHLENMLKLARMGVRIIPAMPSLTKISFIASSSIARSPGSSAPAGDPLGGQSSRQGTEVSRSRCGRDCGSPWR